MHQRGNPLLVKLWDQLPDSVQVTIIILALLASMLLVRYGYTGELL